MIVMGKTDPDTRQIGIASNRKILVPMDTPGVKIVRDMACGVRLHRRRTARPLAKCLFENVKSTGLKNMILGEGRGFEIAQVRLRARPHSSLRALDRPVPPRLRSVVM